MADFNTKQYLDLAGLKAFWGIIKDKFVSNVTLSMGDSGAVFEGSFGDGDKLTIGTIPMADSTKAGLMSAAQAKTVAEFSDGVATLIPLTAVKVNGTAASLDSRAVNLDFIYDSTAKEIQVVDKNNSNAVLTKIDATDFIKDGMISDVRLDGNNLVIDFNTDSGIQDIAIPFDKFIDVYTGTNGVKVEGKAISLVTNSDYLAADASGLKVTDALWTEVGRLDTAVATAAATDATNKANTAKAEAITEAGKLADAAKTAAEGTAATFAGNAENAAKKYTDDLIGGALAGEGTATVKGYVDAEIAKVVGTNGSLADVLEDAKDYTDGLVGTLPEGSATVVAAIDAAKTAANGYADGLNTAMNTRVEALEAIDHDHDNKTVLDGITAVKVSAWDAAEGNAKAYTDGKIGTLPSGSTTVVAAINAASKTAEDNAKAYADSEVGKAYAAVTAIPVADITFEKLNA